MQGLKVGFVEGDVHHLWHGQRANRRYTTRHRILNRHLFDPWADIGLDRFGALHWTSRKPELHAEVREYFASRKEDGEEK